MLFLSNINDLIHPSTLTIEKLIYALALMLIFTIYLNLEKYKSNAKIILLHNLICLLPL